MTARAYTRAWGEGAHYSAVARLDVEDEHGVEPAMEHVESELCPTPEAATASLRERLRLLALAVGLEVVG
jgi:hypothetical protein